MKKKILITVGAVIAVIAVVVSVVFLIKNNKTEVENPSETTSQNDVTVIDETTEESTTEEAKKTIEVKNVMKETIDLKSVDLTKYGLTKEAEISVPYPTLLGCVYVVRDHGQAPERTYLFVTTKDKVMFHDPGFSNSGEIYLKDFHPVIKSYSLITKDLDGEKGEEIVLNSNTGGNGGYGIYEYGIYKINNGKIEEMKISDEKPFDVTLEAPYTVIFRNKKLNYEKTIVCDTDTESLFDDDGYPEPGDGGSYDGGFHTYHSVTAYNYSDEHPKVCFDSYSYLSRSIDGDEQVFSSVTYVYDAKTKQFVISDVGVSVYEPDNGSYYETKEEYYDSFSYTNGYIYYDINKDGIDEFITHTGTCEADRTYTVYTFDKGKMYCAGEIGGWHGMFYANNNGGFSVVGSGSADSGSFLFCTIYELVGNQLFEKDSYDKIVVTEAEFEAFFDEINKNGKELEINNVYYR